MNEEKVNADNLVGADEMPVCKKCGCMIITDVETGSSLCNCTFTPQEQASPETVPEAAQEAQAAKEDQPKGIKELLAEMPGAPSQAQINEWKAQHGAVYVSPFSESEMYIWRPVLYGEFQKLRMNKHLVEDETKLQEHIVTRAVLWPNIDPIRMQVSRAGLVPTMYSIILQGSHFLPIDLAMSLVSEL